MTDDSPAAPYRLLIVDDDEAILDEFRETFAARPAPDDVDALEADLFGSTSPSGSRPEFELTTCTQGAPAVKAVAQARDDRRPFTAAFIDVRMPPGIDGVVAAKQIRHIDPQLPIIFITGFADRNPDDLQHEVPPPSKVQCVYKPFRVSDFVQLAAALCTP